MCLSRGTADEEPLVNRAVNLLSRELLVGRKRRQLVGAKAVDGLRNVGVGNGNTVGRGLAGDETLPSLGALTDNIHGVLPILALASESKLVLGLAVGDLVDTEPLIGGSEKTRQVALDVLNVVEFRSKRVIYVNNDDLPVSLFLIKESHDAENLDLLDLPSVTDKLADLANVERVVVALGLGLRVDDVGILPGLGEGTIVPQVTLVGKAVANVSKLALLDVLLDRVEELLLGDLKLSISPSRNLNNHVQDGLLLVGIEGNIVEGGDGNAILFDVDTVLQGVWSGNLAKVEVGGHAGQFGAIQRS